MWRPLFRCGFSALWLAAAAGCSSIFGVGGPDLQVRFDVEPSLPQDLRLEIEVGGRSFRFDGPGAVYDHAPRTGELPVTVRLSASGQVLAATSFSQTFSNGYDHWVSSRAGGQRPLGFCIGALTVVPIGPPVSDTLFVMHGNLAKGAIC